MRTILNSFFFMKFLTNCLPKSLECLELPFFSRTDSSSSGHSAPGVRPSTFGFHQEKNPTSSFSNNSAQESKRTESQFSKFLIELTFVTFLRQAFLQAGIPQLPVPPLKCLVLCRFEKAKLIRPPSRLLFVVSGTTKRCVKIIFCLDSGSDKHDRSSSVARCVYDFFLAFCYCFFFSR